MSTVPRGASVTALSGLSEVLQPDRVVVTAALPELDLAAGDEVLRYTERGEGHADFWAKGRWHADADLGWVRNADGSGCQSQCKGRERARGSRRWWLQIRLADGRVGWTQWTGVERERSK